MCHHIKIQVLANVVCRLSIDAFEGKHARDRIILCNFNKIDKLDFESFSVWLQIMQKLPTSVLWLLRPVEKNYSRDKFIQSSVDSPTQQAVFVERHLHAFAASMGVAPHRIVFLGRVSKEEHVRRHNEVDLFLDTLTYGAHSTATDALKGVRYSFITLSPSHLCYML